MEKIGVQNARQLNKNTGLRSPDKSVREKDISEPVDSPKVIAFWQGCERQRCRGQQEMA